jgi:hypothetical protein
MDMNIEHNALLIHEAIFAGLNKVEIDGEIHQIEQTSKSKVRLVRYGGLTFIEQNPFKSSQWGKEAQEGHQIMWVMRGRQYLARVRDGKFLDLSKK